MMASPEGAVGDLSGKSLAQLLEVLQRQEKLLSNKKFIARLPDRGQKILDYTEKVQAAIARHRRLEETTSLLSAFRLEFEEKRRLVTERSHPAAPEDKPIPQHAGSGSAAAMSETEATHHSLPVASTSEIEHGPSDGADGRSVLEDGKQKPGRNGASSADDLVDGLQMISIEDSRGNRETSLKDNNILNPSAKKSHFVEVIETRTKNPENQKEKFRTNRLPSDSNSSTPNQSPGERALRLSAEERRAQDRKHLDDITAARLPPLHHSPAQLLPLEESLTLQIAQKKSYEEKQAKLAAHKLFEKLNIRMGPFNPEGDSYMKYRDHHDEEGYGAEE